MSCFRSPRALSRRRLLVGALAFGTLAVACSQPTALSTAKPKPAAPATAPAQAASPTVKPGGQAPAINSGGVAISGPFDGEAKALNGAGATFPAVLYSKWFNEYEKLTGVKVNYQSIGSGGGIKSIRDGTVDFGATDGPMTDEQLRTAKHGNVLHIPTALGAVVPTYSVPEAAQTPLKFTPETLSGLFLGEITKWNDPRLVADNPVLQSVNKEIVTVHRSDGSGTTYVWVDYLASVSPEWKSRVGVGTSVKWPVGLGAKGNEGVAGEVKQSTYALGYIELIYALQSRLGVGQVKNKAGAFVAPELASVTAAAASAAGSIPDDLRASIVNPDGADAYPISGFTWLLVYETMTDLAKATALTRLLWWATHEAQAFNADLGYAVLPPQLVSRVEAKIRSINVGGEKAFPER